MAFKLFSKEACAFCGTEVGGLHRTKLADKEYICNECLKQGSLYYEPSRFTVDEVKEHFAYMENQDIIYAKEFEGKYHRCYPSTITTQGIIFCDEIGMFEIVDRNPVRKCQHHELFRYDQVWKYERYVERFAPQEGQKEGKFKEAGIKIRFMPNRAQIGLSRAEEALVAHPFIDKEIKLCFTRNEFDFKKADPTDNCIAHFDHIFGKHDSERGLFSFGSKQEKRDMKAGIDMLKSVGSIIKAAQDGVDIQNDAGVANQISETIGSLNSSQYGAIYQYSKAADEAIARALG